MTWIECIILMHVGAYKTIFMSNGQNGALSFSLTHSGALEQFERDLINSKL